MNIRIREVENKTVSHCVTSALLGLRHLSLPALLEFNQAVLVSRKDPESRRKAVAQLNERLTSNGYWPQVRAEKLRVSCVFWGSYWLRVKR